jgi:hypothetical protein
MQYFQLRRLAQALTAVGVVCFSVAIVGPQARTASAANPVPAASPQSAPEQNPSPGLLLGQPQADVDQKSTGCVSCHTSTDSATMHMTGTVHLGCADCHGGDAQIMLPAGAAQGSPGYEEATRKAHPQPRFAQNARSSANPVRAYSNWLKEDLQFIKFVNPGDLRVAEETCGRSGCHLAEVQRVRTSMMTHGAML